MASQQYPPQGPYPPPDAPPPYMESAPPGPAPAQAQGVSNVKVEKSKPKEKKGFLGSLMKEAEKISKEIGVQIDKAGEKINETVDKNYSSSLLDLFKHGNQIQLVSRVSGKTVQIVMSPMAQLVLDANGPLDPRAFNTLWTVVNENNNQVRLHNFDNYIAIVDGLIVVKPYLAGSTHGLESKFQLSQLQQQFITFESLSEKGRHLAFMPNGELKPALASGKEPNSQFGIKLVSTAYPVITPVTTAPQKK